jgi:hypothetical protein
MTPTWSFLPSGVALAVAACAGPPPSSLSIAVRIAPDPGVLADVETFALSVLDADRRPLVLRRFDRAARSLRLDEVPFGPRLAFLLEGLVASGPIVRGESCPADVVVGGPYPAVSMLVSRVGWFVPTEPPPEAVRRQPLAFVRSGGAVLVAGGANAAGQPLASVDSYDPRSGRWRAEAPLAGARAGGEVAALADGGAILVGGLDEAGPSARIELFQPDLGFRAVPGWSQPLGVGMRATTLPDGRVLITGGAIGAAAARPQALLFEDGSVHPAGALAVGRRHHTVSVVGAGELSAAFLIGGDEGAERPALGEIEVYNPRASGDRGFGGIVARLITARAEHSATVLRAGDILIAGGRNQAGPVVAAETFDPITRTMLEAGQLAYPRVGHTATLLRDGRVLITGGQGAGGEPLRAVEIFDPAIRNFVAARPLTVERAEHAAVELCDGTVLLVGGGPGAEIYNPAR